MRRVTLIFSGLLAFLAPPAMAADSSASLALPAPATRTFSQAVDTGAFALASGPWRDGQMATLAATGHARIETWRLPGKGQATGALLEMLADQLAASDYEVLFQCTQDECGGFDFRFSIDVVNEPRMHVDLGDYRYLLARKASEAGDFYMTLVVSSSPGAGFVQITRIDPMGAETDDTATVTSTMTEPAEALLLPGGAPLGEQLEQNGFAVLSDLEFPTGSSELGAGPFASLQALASYLRDNPTRSIALVGHTDAEGPLEVNIRISKRRAESVRKRLIEEYGLPETQLGAEGVGFLSPLDSNQTENGRNKNRRVEVILTSTR